MPTIFFGMVLKVFGGKYAIFFFITIYCKAFDLVFCFALSFFVSDRLLFDFVFYLVTTAPGIP